MAKPSREVGLSSQETRAAWDALPIAHVLLESCGLVRHVNAAAAQMLGCPQPRFVGLPFSCWIAAEDRAIFLNHLLRCRAGEASLDSALHLLAADGGRVPVQMLSRRAIDRGEPVFATALLERTEQLVAERGWNRAETRTADAERERNSACEREEAKDDLLSIVSHELRNPLNPALMAAQSLAAMKDLPPDARHLSDIVARNVRLEAQLVNDLLDLARINRGRLQIRLGLVDVHGVLQDSVAACESAIGEHHVAVVTRFDAPDAAVLGDGARLRQLFWNLISNAIKFSDLGGEILISTAAAGSDWIRITVQDWGHGMDAAAEGGLFHPPDRRMAAGARSGLGLGLVIGKAIVDAHGGRIAGRSAGVNTGATFDVELRLAHTRRSAPAHSADVATAEPRAQSAATRRLRILVIDDHDDTRALLEDMLQHRGHEVVSAPTLAEGLERLRERWDVILSDLALGDGSGREIARRVRTVGETRPLVVALTGFGGGDETDANRRAGFDDQILKPVDLDRLCALIEQPRRPASV